MILILKGTPRGPEDGGLPINRFIVPGLFTLSVFFISCAGVVATPPSAPTPEIKSTSTADAPASIPESTREIGRPPGSVGAPFPNTHGSGRPGPTIDISGCATVLCCSDCRDLDVDWIIDGDTFASDNARIRLFGVDTPERGQRCFSEATDRLRKIAGDVVLVESGPRAEDRYGRALFYVYTGDGESIDEILVREGLAIAWLRDGQHRDVLALAEEEARKRSRGCLWQPGS
jgi:endonuclease YncB( thermonuclease family)